MPFLVKLTTLESRTSGQRKEAVSPQPSAVGQEVLYSERKSSLDLSRAKLSCSEGVKKKKLLHVGRKKRGCRRNDELRDKEFSQLGQKRGELAVSKGPYTTGEDLLGSDI